MFSLKTTLKRNGRFLLALACFAALRMTVADYMLVPSGSMNPTLLEGDYILANRAAYGLRIPFTTIHLTPGKPVQRGDIVVFKSPEDGQTLVKRVVGMPGDKVEMKNDQLLVNGEAFVYPPAKTEAGNGLLNKTEAQQHLLVDEIALAHGVMLAHTHPIMLLPGTPARRDFSPVSVPGGEYLMLGDNRDNSRDSRYFGFVPQDHIIGRVRQIFFSLNPDHYFLPRVGRTLKRLS
jgi:signal peptidase I